MSLSIIRHSPEVFTAYFACLMTFPMYGLDAEVDQIAANPNIAVQLLWEKEDVAITYKSFYAKWRKHFDHKACQFTSKVFEKAGHSFLLEKHQEVKEAIGNFITSLKN
jgi:pimeloyl-ACP methyl ester carboxylesterase